MLIKHKWQPKFDVGKKLTKKLNYINQVQGTDWQLVLKPRYYRTKQVAQIKFRDTVLWSYAKVWRGKNSGKVVGFTLGAYYLGLFWGRSSYHIMAPWLGENSRVWLAYEIEGAPKQKRMTRAETSAFLENMIGDIDGRQANT